MSRPNAVLISDIHFTPSTLELASYALKAAIDKAKELEVPLIIAGDTLDTKAVIRGECANRLIEIISMSIVPINILVGNHDLLNEKGTEHSLNFLKPYCIVVDRPMQMLNRNLWMVPYQSCGENLRWIFDDIPKGSTIIMHQGVHGADMGHYVQDKTSLPKEAFKDFRVISGHYHKRQDIKCGPPRKGAVGLFSYIGNPYTQNFGEAKDGEKGFQVLMDNGLLEFHALPLRNHVILEYTVEELKGLLAAADAHEIIGVHHMIHTTDPVWLKVTGPRSELDKLDKKYIGEALFAHTDYKLDKIYLDNPGKETAKVGGLTDIESLYRLIDKLPEDLDYKKYLKDLAKELLSADKKL